MPEGGLRRYSAEEGRYRQTFLLVLLTYTTCFCQKFDRAKILLCIVKIKMDPTAIIVIAVFAAFGLLICYRRYIVRGELNRQPLLNAYHRSLV
jgi:hypothetical protein